MPQEDDPHVYLAIKKGVYRHEIVGVRLSLHHIKKDARVWLKKQEDYYHSVLLVRVGIPLKEEEEVVGEVRWLFKDLMSEEPEGIAYTSFEEESEDATPTK